MSAPSANPGNPDSIPNTAGDGALARESKRIGDMYASFESRLLWDWLCGGNRHWAYYDSPATTWWPFPLRAGHLRMQSKLLEALALPPGSRVLDAGCGDGHVAIRLARLGGLRITAFDVVDRHVANARRNVRAAGLDDLKSDNIDNIDGSGGSGGQGQGQVEVVQMGFDELRTVPDASYDGVYTSEALVHAPDAPRVLAQFRRILRPGGRLVLHEYHNDFMNPDVVGFPAEIARMKADDAPAPTHQEEGDAPPPPAFVRVKRYFTDVMARTGFEDVVVRNYSPNVEPMARLLSISAWWRYVVLFFRLQRLFPNIARRAEGRVGQEHWAYVSVSGTKPAAAKE